MPTQIMLDLETLGTKPGSVITSIGAVKFSPRGYEDYPREEITDTFYERVDIESCVALGLTLDVSTVLWWMKQSDEARAELNKPGIRILDALTKFAKWVCPDEEARVWGNGASFDNAMLSAAYDRCAIKRPWKYSNDRCYRTVKNLFPDVEMERTGTHHNALDDARSQALHLMQIFEKHPPTSL